MDPIPFTDPASRVLFDALLALFALQEVGIRIFSSRNSAEHQERPEQASFLVLIVAFAVAIVGSLVIAGRVPAGVIPFAREGLFVASIVLMAAGIAVRTWSVVTLGRSFTVQVRVRDDQQVVDRGPFAVVRHPSYSGLLLVFLGLGLGLGNWLAVIVAFLPPLAAILYRISVEEAMLVAGLGDPYRSYRERVRFRLVPGLY